MISITRNFTRVVHLLTAARPAIPVSVARDLRRRRFHSDDGLSSSGQRRDLIFPESVHHFLNEAALYTDDMSADLLTVIRAFANVTRFRFPLLRDDGKVEIITAFRGQHCTHFFYQRFEEFDSSRLCARKR